MRAGFKDVMPLAVRRGLKKLGTDLSIARRKRRLTVNMMLERTGLSKATYERVEAGEPTVAIGAYTMCLFALGFGNALSDLIDQSHDQTGLLLDQQRLPQRIRAAKSIQEQ